VPDIETEIEPPIFDTNDEDPTPTIGISANVFEVDGTYRGGNVQAPADADDDTIAAHLVAAIRAVAALRGPGLESALARLLVDSP